MLGTTAVPRARFQNPGSADPGCIAFIEITRLIARPEPLLALRGRAVRPPLWLNATLRLLLDAIVANGCGGIQRLADLGVGGRLEITGVRGMPGPDAGKAVGLKLDPHRLRIRSGLREETELVLHVVAVLVGDDVALREGPALRAEALRQLLEEADVEIDLLVVGAVERTHRSLGEPAGALRRVGVEDGLRREIRVASARELVAPILLDAVDETDDAAIVALVRVGPGLAVLH